MKEARNMNELNTILLKEIQSVMTDFSKTALSDVQGQVDEFYTYAQPKMYERTGTLKKSPKISNVNIIPNANGGRVEFEAYLDENHKYETGKKPTMHQVLEVAETHKMCSYYKLRAPVGHQGFWKRSEKSMERNFKAAMKRKFKAVRAVKK